MENYTQSGVAGDLQPFMVNGQQMQIYDLVDGTLGTAWLTPSKQVVISYEGTLGETPQGLNLAFYETQSLNDDEILLGVNGTQGEISSLNFAQQVAAAAAAQGISASNIFVTGHSLGAMYASYVAESTGFGGIAFESGGIPPIAGAQGDGSNFVSVDTYGDATPGYSSTETVLGTIAPTDQPLYGQVLHIGDPAWQTQLISEAQPYQTAAAVGGKAVQAAAFTAVFEDDLAYHMPETQAYALGVALPPNNSWGANEVDTTGVASGPVLDVGNDTLSQLLDYIAETDGNTQNLPSAATTASTDAESFSVAAPATSAAHIDNKLVNFVSAMASMAPHEGSISTGAVDPYASGIAPSLAMVGGSPVHGAHALTS
jgi:hypothetical protein